MLAIYTFVFGVVFKVRLDPQNNDFYEDKFTFALLLFTGLILFNLFSECLSRAPGLILANVNYVKKVIFPLEILPLVALGSALFHAGISFLVLISFLLIINHPLHLTMLLLPIIVLPFVMWSLYLKFKIQASTSGKFDLGIGYNSERMDMMIGYVKAMLFAGRYRNIDGGQLYGLSFVLFFAASILSFGWLVREGIKTAFDRIPYVLIFTATSFILYFLVFYFIDVNVQSAPMWSLMESSFKRGIFCFLPLGLYFAATNRASTWLFGRLQQFLLQ